jgi:hypothetical protein
MKNKMIKPVIVYGFPTDKRLEGDDEFKTGLTSYPGKLIYYVNASYIYGENITENEQFNAFREFARFHNKVPAYMLAVIVE